MTDLLNHHDVLLCDLDGTLYAGHAAVPGSVDAVRAAADRGVRSSYITNNASRSPSEVAEHLRDLGFPATDDDVVTSAQAGAAMLAQQLPPGSPVLVVGAPALVEEVTNVGLRPVETGDEAIAVVQGHSPDTGWRLLAEAMVALRNGALWVATNPDATLPTARGPLPGNGAMVAALVAATGLTPQVAGKPEPNLLYTAAERTGATSPLMIGDRLDTDVAGGRAAGMASMLVLTGIAGPSDVLTAPAEQRPDYIGADMAALNAHPDEVAVGKRSGWTVDAGPAGECTLSGTGDPLDALRALCSAHWAVGGGPVRVRAGGGDATEALAALGLSENGAGPGEHP